MKNPTNIAALRIAQLLEEFSEAEISNAVKILERNNTTSRLLSYLKKSTIGKPASGRKASRTGATKTKPIHEVTSQAVRLLEKKDPEKHAILLEFDKLIRQNKILPRGEDLRRFGESITKEFKPRKSRKDNISALLKVMAELSPSDVEALARQVLEEGADTRSDEYQNLARFLIKGGEE